MKHARHVQRRGPRRHARHPSTQRRGRVSPVRRRPLADVSVGQDLVRCEAAHRPGYLTQVAGPRALDALERARARVCATSVSCASAIRGSPARRSRSAASACPATSPSRCAGRSRRDRRSMTPSIKANRDFGMERLGWRTYLVNHVEGGFPQLTWTFVPPRWSRTPAVARAERQATTSGVKSVSCRAATIRPNASPPAHARSS